MHNLLTPAPDFQHPLQLLHACHGRITGFNDLLLRLPAHLEAHGVDADAKQAAQRLLKYFDTAGRHHHEDEEHNLFPMVREAALAQDNHDIPEILDLLIAQHREMEQAWQALRQELLKLAEGQAVDPMALPVEGFVSLYRQHMPLEDEQLLPYASKVLSPAQLESLGDAMGKRRGI